MTGGNYQFCTGSDDGSWLTIDGTQIVNNGGPHGYKKVCNTVKLEAGHHFIEVRYSQGALGNQMKMNYNGPDTDSKDVSIEPSLSVVHPTCSASMFAVGTSLFP